MQVTKQTYNTQGYTDSNSVIIALNKRPDVISPNMVFLAGREDKRFPITFLTEGMQNTKIINGNEYEYRVNVKTRRSRPLSVATGGNMGASGVPFKLTFSDAWFIKDYVLVSSSGVQLRIVDGPVNVGTGYEYTVQLVNPSLQPFLPAADGAVGKLFAMLFAPVASDFSRGNKSNWSAPSLVRHKIGTIRKSYEMSGGSKGFVADFEFTLSSGKKTNLWMDWEEYQYYLQWLEEQENYFMYGIPSYDEKGNTVLRDERGRPIIVSPGLLEQVQIKDEFSVLTEAKIRDLIGDAFYGMTDATNKQVTLLTGQGGLRDFDAAMKNYLSSNTWIRTDSANFISGQGHNLSLGGYFTQYKHVDGHTVNVVHAPMFDHGAVAEAANRHPITGFSLESHRMVFIDTSRYDGESNLFNITKANRQMVRWAVAGSFVPNGYGSDANMLRASDVDGASVHFLKEGGILLRRFDTSIDLRCVAS